VVRRAEAAVGVGDRGAALALLDRADAGVAEVGDDGLLAMRVRQVRERFGQRFSG
jgi:hypothetical protein